MKFNTHGSTSKQKTSKLIKIILTIELVLFYGLVIFCAIVCSLYIHSVAPATIILVPLLIPTVVAWIQIRDMEKAYIEVDGDAICVVDYYLWIKKEKRFCTQDIVGVEIIRGYSMRVRGYRWGSVGMRYIVFRGRDNRYMFKVIYSPETKEFFEKYIKIGDY